MSRDNRDHREKQPSREDLIAQIGLAIAEWQNEAQAFDEAASERLGVNQTDLRCLSVLAFHGPMSVGKLAETSGLSPGAMTAAVDRWEKAGYARRSHSKEDRRSVFVELTPKALRRTGEIWGPLASEGAAKLQRYTTEELLFLQRFLASSTEFQVEQTARLTGRPAPPHAGKPTYPPGFPAPLRKRD
jgi:DNA-binding MarR family transcriptional regulator